MEDERDFVEMKMYVWEGIYYGERGKKENAVKKCGTKENRLAHGIAPCFQWRHLRNRMALLALPALSVSCFPLQLRLRFLASRHVTLTHTRQKWNSIITLFYCFYTKEKLRQKIRKHKKTEENVS